MNEVLQGFFTNRAMRRFLVRIRFLLFLVLIVPVARYMRPDLLPGALAVSFFGQVIQTWCFASLVKNRELSIRGPYLVVRNPMYLGRYFLILGFVLLPGNVWLIAGYTVVYYLYMHFRVKGEEGRLRRAFGDDFEAYCRKVNRFFPTVGRLGDRGVWFFDKSMMFENHGHWNILLTVVAYAGVWGLHRLWLAA